MNARSLRSAAFGLALLLPSLIFIGAFTLWPLLDVLVNSLYRRNLATRLQPQWDGLGNFARLFDDPEFWHVLGNTLLVAAITVPVSIVLAFDLALLVNRKIRGVQWLRSAVFYPTILPMVSAATIWLLLYNVDFGLFNTLLKAAGLKPVNFIGTSEWILPALCLMMIWKQAGYFMLFYLAGMQGLPTDVMEAAKLDGASAWQTLRTITLPLLRGTTIFVLTIAVTSAFQTVDHHYIIGQGGPNNASNVLLFNIFETNFRFQNVGSAYAMTVILILLMLAFTVLNAVIADRRSHDV